MIRHGDDDLERDPDLRVTAAWVTLVIAVSILVGWIIGARLG